jgi:hypothetical protein
MAFSETAAVSYANDYVQHFDTLPNIYLCAYPGYKDAESFLSLRPFFKHAKGTGVEVGTFEGYNAVNVIKYCPIDKLYCIDPYIPYNDVVGGLGNFSVQAFDALHRKVVDRVSTKAEVVRKPSLVAVNDWLDNSLDFVYLDGDHSRENVTREITSWLPKIKVGGILGGHDCRENGVSGAITEWNYKNPEYDNKIFIQSSDWWIIKEC